MSSSTYHNSGERAENKGFWKELKASYKNRSHDPQINRLSSRFCTIYFWFTAITQMHVVVNYIIPHHFADYSDVCQYYLKVTCWFVFIQLAANWACVLCYDTSYRASADRSYSANKSTTARPLPAEEPSRNDNVDRFSDERKSVLLYGSVISSATGSRCSQSESVGIDVTDVSAYSRDSFHLQSEKPHEYRTLHWWWCCTCQCKSPPRTHHCVVCNKCIIKRDHHCYMTGVCIGYYNQRYFVVLSAYTALASILGLYFIVGYLHTMFAPTASYSDFVLPLTFYRWLVSGTVEVHHLFMLCHVYTLWWSGLAGSGFFCWHLAIIATGKTTFEVRKEVGVRSTSSVAENFRSVFGNFWGLNFIFPAQILFRQSDDWSNWNMKPE